MNGVSFLMRRRFATLVVLVGFAASSGAWASTSAGDDEDDLIPVPRVSDSGFTGPLLNRILDIGNRAGFEIGNGKPMLITNEPGRYKLKIYEKWDVGQASAFTEIISRLEEGVPRARLQINVVQSESVVTADDVLNIRRRDPSWIPVVVGKLQGVQRERVLSSGVHEVEVQLFRDRGEVIMLNLDGKPGSQEVTPFDRVLMTLPSFQTVQ